MTVARLFSTGEGSPEERLRAGLEEANREIFEAARLRPELEGMGTTGVASQQGMETIEGQGPPSEAQGAEASAPEQQGMHAGSAAQAKGAARSPRVRLRATVRCRALIGHSFRYPPELVNLPIEPGRLIPSCRRPAGSDARGGGSRSFETPSAAGIPA